MANISVLGLTYVVIVLIVISIFVTCSEIFLRFGMLSTTRGGGSSMKNQILPLCVPSSAPSTVLGVGEL